MPNLKPDEMLLECSPCFAELPDGEYGKGIIFSGNAKYEPLKQFISQHNPRHLRVVVADNSVVGLVQKQDPWVIKQQQEAAEAAERAAAEKAKPVAPKVEVALDDKAGDNAPAEPVEMKKGPGGRLFPVKK